MDHQYKKGEMVIHREGLSYQQEVIYISDFMYKGEHWFNIQLPNGGFMETKFITQIKKPSTP